MQNATRRKLQKGPLQSTAGPQIVAIPASIQDGTEFPQFSHILESLLMGSLESARGCETEKRGRPTSTNSFPFTPLLRTPLSAPVVPASLVTNGNKLANLAVFSLTSSNRAPRSSAPLGVEALPVKAGSSRCNNRAKSASSERARTSAASGESSASDVSCRRVRKAGGIGSRRAGLEARDGGKSCELDAAGGDAGGEGT